MTFACNQHFSHTTWNPTGEIPIKHVFNTVISIFASSCGTCDKCHKNATAHSLYLDTGVFLPHVPPDGLIMFNSTPNSHMSPSFTHFLLKNDMSDQLE